MYAGDRGSAWNKDEASSEEFANPGFGRNQQCFSEDAGMIQVTAQMRILVAVEPADFRCGIDGLARICKEHLKENPFSGALYIFRNRRGTSIKVLAYDSQGFWLCHKRLSSGRFRFWPGGTTGTSRRLEAHELQVLLAAGNPESVQAAPPWRRVSPAA
jgi:transposase